MFCWNLIFWDSFPASGFGIAQWSEFLLSSFNSWFFQMENLVFILVYKSSLDSFHFDELFAYIGYLFTAATPQGWTYLVLWRGTYLKTKSSLILSYLAQKTFPFLMIASSSHFVCHLYPLLFWNLEVVNSSMSCFRTLKALFGSCIQKVIFVL